jgi:porin
MILHLGYSSMPIVLLICLWTEEAKAEQIAASRTPSSTSESSVAPTGYSAAESNGAATGKETLTDIQHGDDFAKEPDAKETDDKEGPEDEKESPSGILGKRFHGGESLWAEYIYTGEVFNNMHGGISTHNATVYRGNLDLLLHGDLEKMGFFPGGKIFIYGQNGHGQGLSADYVGDFQVLSNIDAPDFMQVSEYWWEREVFKDFATLRIGKQDCNAEFAVVQLGGDFVNSSFGVPPNIPMPTFPNGSMAAATYFKLSEKLSFKAGIWDGLPNGENWGFSGSGELFSIYEFKRSHDLFGKKLHGELHAGMWYHSGSWEDLTAEPSLSAMSFASFNPFRNYRYYGKRGSSSDEAGILSDRHLLGNHGVYLGLDQMLYREDSEDEKNDQGLGMFVQYSYTPEDRSPAPHYVGGGLVYKGIAPRRDDDTMGIGVAHVKFSRYLSDRTAETAIELFYKAQITKHASVLPDLQYIVSPGGMYPDAFAVGLRYELAL